MSGQTEWHKVLQGHKHTLKNEIMRGENEHKQRQGAGGTAAARSVLLCQIRRQDAGLEGMAMGAGRRRSRSLGRAAGQESKQRHLTTS